MRAVDDGEEPDDGERWAVDDLMLANDQGLPVVKYHGFGDSVNITLGLPVVRTSVDHGTALNLAGRGLASTGGLVAAIREANRLTAQIA